MDAAFCSKLFMKSCKQEEKKCIQSGWGFEPGSSDPHYIKVKKKGKTSKLKKTFIINSNSSRPCKSCTTKGYVFFLLHFSPPYKYEIIKI